MKDGIDPDETNGHVRRRGLLRAARRGGLHLDGRPRPTPSIEPAPGGLRDACAEATDAKGRKLKVHKLMPAQAARCVTEGEVRPSTSVEGSLPRTTEDVRIASYAQLPHRERRRHRAPVRRRERRAGAGAGRRPCSPTARWWACAPARWSTAAATSTASPSSSRAASSATPTARTPRRAAETTLRPPVRFTNEEPPASGRSASPAARAFPGHGLYWGTAGLPCREVWRVASSRAARASRPARKPGRPAHALLPAGRAVWRPKHFEDLPRCPLTLLLGEVVECVAEGGRKACSTSESSRRWARPPSRRCTITDRIGLLHPEAVDGATGYRLYTTRQLAETAPHPIVAAGGAVGRGSGRHRGRSRRAQPILARRRDEIEREELATRQDRLARIAFMIDNQEKGYCMDYQATIKELPSCVVFSKVMTVPDYSAYSEGHPRPRPCREGGEPRSQVRHARILLHRVSGRRVQGARHHDEVFGSRGVVRRGDRRHRVRGSCRGGHRGVRCMHRGSYADLPSAYAFAMEWVEQNGYRVAGLFRESCIEGVWSGAPESPTGLPRNPSSRREEVTCPVPTRHAG